MPDSLPAKNYDANQSVEVNSTVLYDLQRIKVTQEVKDELIKWARVWLGGLTAVMMIIGIFGINVFLEGMINEELNKAKIAVIQVEDFRNHAKGEFEEFKTDAEDIFDNYRTTVDDLQSVADNVANEFTALRANLSTATESIDAKYALNVELLEKRISGLEESISGLMTSLNATEYLMTFNDEQATIKNDLNQLRREFVKNEEVQIWFFGPGYSPPTDLRMKQSSQYSRSTLTPFDQMHQELTLLGYRVMGPLIARKNNNKLNAIARRLRDKLQETQAILVIGHEDSNQLSTKIMARLVIDEGMNQQVTSQVDNDMPLREILIYFPGNEEY